jgi:hypothetical protein
MRRLLLLTVILLPFIVSSQNFIVKDGSILWQKVYEGTPSFRVLSDVEKLDSIIIGKIENHSTNYKKQGYGSMNVPILVRDELLNANARIDIKEGRYRVTLTNIVFSNTNQYLGAIGSPTTAESYFIKKGNITDRPAMLSILKIIDVDLEDLFTPDTPDKDNW